MALGVAALAAPVVKSYALTSEYLESRDGHLVSQRIEVFGRLKQVDSSTALINSTSMCQFLVPPCPLDEHALHKRVTAVWRCKEGECGLWHASPTSC